MDSGGNGSVAWVEAIRLSDLTDFGLSSKLPAFFEN